MHKDHIGAALLIVALLCLLGLTVFTKAGFAVLITVWTTAAVFVAGVLLVGRRRESKLKTRN
jgi:hypothetical protein